MSLFKRSRTERWLNALPKRVSSSAMILENSVGQALIVKANYKPYWTFPGGIVDPGETPLEGAIRETREEVGIALKPTDVAFVAVVNRKSDFAETFQFIFKATIDMGSLGGVVLQQSEIDEYALITKSQVKTRDRRYGKVIEHWAAGKTGYIEQTFGKGEE